MKAFFLTLLIFTFLTGNSNPLQIQGRLDTNLSSIEDTVFVCIFWRGNDGRGQGSNRTYSNVSSVSNDGSFKIEIKESPDSSSIKVISNGELKLSVGFLLAFKDKNSNGTFDMGETIGMCLDYGISYVEGNYKDVITKMISKTDDSLRVEKIKMRLEEMESFNEFILHQGINLNKVSAKALIQESYGKKVKFDKLIHTAESPDLIIKSKKEGTKFKLPNWT